MSRNIIAILRGIKPEEVEDIGRTIISSGISYIEVALNSPMPFQSMSDSFLIRKKKWLLWKLKLQN